MLPCFEPCPFSVHKGESEKFNAHFSGSEHRQGSFFSAGYEGVCKGEDWKGNLTFKQILPEGLPEQIQEILQDESLQEFLSQLGYFQWLQANRLVDGEPGGTRPLRCCQPDGTDLAKALRGAVENEVLEKVSKWLDLQELAKEVKIHRSSDRPPEIALDGLRLALAGEGLRTLLPVLLCAAWAETKNEYAPKILAIEEPESNLHPTLHVALLDRLIETTKLVHHPVLILG